MVGHSPQFVRFPQQFACTRLCSWVERGTVRVTCLTRKHNTMSPAWVQTRSTRPRVERTNYEATAPTTQQVESEKSLTEKKKLRTSMKFNPRLAPIGFRSTALRTELLFSKRFLNFFSETTFVSFEFNSYSRYS